MGSFPETYKGGFVQFFARSKTSPDPGKQGLTDDVFFYNIRILQPLLRRKTTYLAKRVSEKKGVTKPNDFTRLACTNDNT